MQDIPVKYDFISIVLSIGIFLGLFISFFFIVKSWRRKVTNLIMGFFILSLSLTMLEGWMNYTGYIFKALWLTNFAEPFNFLIAPLLYLFVISQFSKLKTYSYLHLIPFGFWLGYCVFFFIQSDGFKYNSNIEVMQLNFPRESTHQSLTDDPLGLRKYVNQLTGVSFIAYNVLIIRFLFIKAKSLGESLWISANRTLTSLRNSMYHYFVIIMIFIIVKLIFKNDVGDYFIFLYLSFMIFITTVQIMNRSAYFSEVSTFLEAPSLKYKKSSLAKDQKNIILKAIISQMEDEKIFKSSNASLNGLANAIKKSAHHVSQVINESLGQSFFEMIATYRIKEAQLILKSDIGKKLTIEEVAERVGYNSKSAFNAAFKKLTLQTPSQYRDS